MEQYSSQTQKSRLQLASWPERSPRDSRTAHERRQDSAGALHRYMCSRDSRALLTERVTGA
jgi:hypothetical protein